ncbi:rod-binding protein [Anaeroselena agilis]|uniref:Rod-binding protein n=1 Tax=Anaeroselena agilis TaxID=3063788 RepID=A0ABU3P413_9FIRM|nr:rod-binding protein [Selenomonadales bacterium 4137-cl]
MQIKGPADAAGAKAPTGRDAKEDAKLKAACTEMEAVFLNLLLKEMRKAVPKGGLVGNSSQEDIMRSLLDSELTKNMAQSGGVGLADMLYRQLSPKDAVIDNKGQAPR